MSGLVFRLISYLQGRPRYITFMLALVLVGLLGLLDYWSGPELSFSIFYLMPIALTAWVAGRRLTMLVSAAAVISWLLAEIAGQRSYLLGFTLYWNAGIRFGYFLLVGYLVMRVREALERERALSRTDSLTGAMNKLAFHETAAYELERVKRYEHPLSLAYIDLDNFKAVNDSLGHAVGDELLTIVVETLKSVMRKTDAVARLGGDEFVVLMVETDAEAARQAFIKAQSSLVQTMRQRGWPVTFSIGIVTFLESPGSADELLLAADTLMYTAKRKGKNRVAYQVVVPTLHTDQPEVTQDGVNQM